MNRGLIIGLIFLLALALRTWSLVSVPRGFHNDEVDVGYVGKYLILNGRDPAGNFLPLAFNKYQDFRPTGLFYLSGISQLVLGSNEFAVRFVTALFGSLTVIVLYLFLKKLWGSWQIATLASFFLAILPWHIVLSRAGHEAIVGYFLVLLGFWLLLRRNWVLACVVLFSSYFFYHGIRLLVPMLLVSSLPFLKGRQMVQVALLFLVLTVLLVAMPLGRGRFSQVVFYKNPNIVKKINELPYADKNNLTSARIFHNKPVVYGRELVANWLQYFSADFLFLRGGYPERYLVPETGHVYLVFLPLMLAGLVIAARMGKSRWLPFVWLLLAPTAAVLTYEDIPSATRASFMVFPIVMVSALGARGIYDALKSFFKRILILAFLVVLFAEGAFFAHQYFGHQKGHKAITRDEGAAEIAVYIGHERENYDQVVAAYGTSLPFYFLFYNGIFDGDMAVDLSDLSADFSWRNVLFSRDRCPTHRFEKFAGKVLYIQEPNCEQRPGEKIIKQVFRSDLTEAYRVIVR